MGVTKDLDMAARKHVADAYKEYQGDNSTVPQVMREAFLEGATWQAQHSRSTNTNEYLQKQVDELTRKTAELEGLHDALPDGAGGIRAERVGGGYCFHAFGDHDAIDAIRKEYQASVPLTEILAAILKVQDGVDAMHSRHNVVRDRFDHVTSMIRDVGEKVEAVLDQVMPQEVNGEACDTAESEVIHWMRRAKELEAERDDWHHAYDKLVSDVVHGRKPAVESKPVTDESGASVGAGLWKIDPEKLKDMKIGVDPAAPGTDKTVISQWVPFTDLEEVIDDRNRHARWSEYWKGVAFTVIDMMRGKAE